MNSWKFIILISFFISCGDKGKNEIIVQQEEERTKEQTNQPSKNQIHLKYGCAHANNRDELISVFENNLLPHTAPVKSFNYTEKTCDRFLYLFIEGKTCEEKTDLGPRSDKGTTFQHEIASSREELIRILVDRIGKSMPYQKLGKTHHRIMDYETGEVWHLNLCLPLIAQPTLKIIIKKPL